jgi:acylphosphatase
MKYQLFKKREQAMSQCLRIVLTMNLPEDFLHNFIKKSARQLDLEGTVQLESDNTIRIIACGSKQSIESFLDALHAQGAKHFLDAVEVEPFIKDRDFRGVFRVIE